MSTQTAIRRRIHETRRKPVLHLAGRDYNWWPNEDGPGYRTAPVITGEILTEKQDAAVEAWIDQLIVAGNLPDTEEQRINLRNIADAVTAPTIADVEHMADVVTSAVTR